MFKERRPGIGYRMAAPIRESKMASPMEININAALLSYNSKLGVEISSLKPAQSNALEAILRGHDVIAAFPTGFGKSLIYEIIPFVNPNACVLVIEPLNVIIQQQLKKLCGLAIFLQKHMNVEDLDKVKKGKFPFIYCHPEFLIGNPEINKLLQGDFFQNDDTVIVIDEAHCVMEWGEEFRTDYKRLSELRAVISKAKILALSATLSKSSQLELIKNLKMKDSKVFVEKPMPDNIDICVEERPPYSFAAKESYRFVFEAIFNEVKTKLNECPLTIVYCSGSMHWIGYGYELAHSILREDIKADNGDPRVIMYHSSVEQDSGELKDRIHQLLSSESSALRVVIASSALGMGADLRYVKRVVHAGPPKSIEAYVQQIGRAGRTGEEAHAVLFYNKSDIGRKEMRLEMREFCKNKDICRRKILINYFGYSSDTLHKTTKCCNICTPDLKALCVIPPVNVEKRESLRVAITELMKSKDPNLVNSMKLEVECIVFNHSIYLDYKNLEKDFNIDLHLAKDIALIIKQIMSFN